jgi:CRISPR-associated endoribonuclease Cas6
MLANDPALLYSIVLKLTPTCEATVRATMGHQAHAAFLHTLQEADPELATALHASNETIRPFTVSPLRGIPRARNKGQVRLSPGRDYWLRFTVLYPPIFERFMARFLGGEGRPTIRLGRAELLIKEILTTPGSHPWAGYTSWAQLAEARPAPEITLAFTTPTAFGFGQKTWGKKVMVLPLPETVFGNLARSWNHLAPPPLQLDRDALMTYVEEHVVVKRLRGLKTQMLRFRRSMQIGFVGQVTYGLMAEDEAAHRQLNALADFAFYTGVGMKTAMGMGQTRRIVLSR